MPTPRATRSVDPRVAFIPQMVARVVAQLPEGDDWIYEVKFDGYRALLLKSAQSVQIRSRNDNDLTRQYPAVAAAADRLHATTAIVDGELVAVDASGHPSFQALQHRGSHPGYQVVFYAFDLLHLNGVDLTRRPLEARRASLPAVVKGSGILLSEALGGTVAQITDAVRGLGLEGVIAKRKTSRYDAGARTRRLAEAETGPAAGVRHRRVSPGPARRRRPARRLLREPHAALRREGARGLHAARAPGGRGAPEATTRRALSVRRSTRHLDRPLGRRRHRRADGRDAMDQADAGRADSVRRVDEGRLRHAAFLGLRTDKAAKDVRREP